MPPVPNAIVFLTVFAVVWGVVVHIVVLTVSSRGIATAASLFAAAVLALVI